jgi:hypothetical protein
MDATRQWTYRSAGTRVRSTSTRLGRFTRRFPVALATTTLVATGGCAHLERFSGQATEFNIQVADAQNKTLLLNIVRAANRFPMHFTELSTLSGTGTVTVGGTLTIPVGILNGGMSTGSVAPTASIAETPTFNVAVLETQEFYKGMLAPISQDQLSTYLEEGLDPELVFSIAIGEILYQPAITADAVRIENNFHPLKKGSEDLCPKPAENSTNPTISEYACFKAVLQALLDRHLTTEPTKSRTNIGALIKQDSFNDLKWLNGLDPKTLKIVAVDAEACSKKADSCPEGMDGLSADLIARLKNKEHLYRVQKETADYRYCFNEDPESDDRTTWKRQIEPFQPGLAAKIRRAHIPPKLICSSRVPKDFKMPEDKKPNTKPLRASDSSLSLYAAENLDDQFTVEVQPRSTEGVIYYLGEIARCDFNLDPNSVCTPRPTVLVKYRHPPAEETLFAVSRFKPTQRLSAESESGSIEVDWADYRYAVIMDPAAVDRSGQVLRILTQLVALNRSAKDFPTPSIVPIISH